MANIFQTRTAVTPTNLNKCGTYRAQSYNPNVPPLILTKTTWNKNNYPLSIYAEEELVGMNPVEARIEDYYNIRTNNLTVNHRNKLTQALRRKTFCTQLYNQPSKSIPSTISNQQKPMGNIPTPTNSTSNYISTGNNFKSISSTTTATSTNIFANLSAQSAQNSNINIFKGNQNMFNSTIPTVQTNITPILNNNQSTIKNIFNTNPISTNPAISQTLNNIFNSTNTTSNNIFKPNTNTNIVNNPINTLNNNSNNIFGHLNNAKPTNVLNQTPQTNANPNPNQVTQSINGVPNYIIVPISQQIYESLFRNKLPSFSDDKQKKQASEYDYDDFTDTQQKRKANQTKVYRFNIAQRIEDQSATRPFAQRIQHKKIVTYRQPSFFQNSITSWKKVKVYQTISIDDKIIQERIILIQIFSNFSIDLMEKLIGNQIVQEGIIKSSPKINILKHSNKQPYEITCEIKGKTINLPFGYYYNIQYSEAGKMKSLSVGNQFGEIKWDDQIDIQAIDFETNILINRNSVILYPDGDLPARNTGLNKTSTLTLFECQFVEKMKRNGKYSKQNARQKLKRICQKAGEQFLEYEESSGYWKVKIHPK